MISPFVGRMDLVKIIFLVFSVVVFVRGEDELIEEISSTDEVVQWAGYGEDKLSTVVIDGKLLCHASFDHRTPPRPFPVSGATVAVFCGRSGKTKRSWVRGSSNGHGQFIIDLPSHLHAIPNLEKTCQVKVLHLPKSSPCRHAFTGKHKAIELTSIGEGIRTYTTHNVHLMPKPSPKQHTRHGPKRAHKASAL
ncbi:hypothetical protein SASPL_152719 [Salvia splendens]|uniref:Pollen Ole e 1 allergen and extensin family protein n=1 Tax=Salvia splendens TaxID=180675 RepID=A0A8X8Z1I6_SALSN|nr:uncharacterized protein LOC121783523 [Salvia splendens]KAG6387527.1 hypothetical protein SASPL_152719 [Salvia splendens]